MDQEAIRMNIPESGRILGILHDEMSIQQKLEIQKCGKSIEMVGFVDMEQESANLSALREGKKSNKLATYLGAKGTVLDGAIELFQNTSVSFGIFRDRRTINEKNDIRMTKLNAVQQWFLNWSFQTDSQKSIIISQYHGDVQSSIIGFLELCNYVIESHPGCMRLLSSRSRNWIIFFSNFLAVLKLPLFVPTSSAEYLVADLSTSVGIHWLFKKSNTSEGCGITASLVKFTTRRPSEGKSTMGKFNPMDTNINFAVPYDTVLSEF
ncbi:hypothetical protein MAR_024508 [Mya arenaria]|uniref:Uncharacterized protein n=1 Tax=Mya arenaria TaxID=6604 RepID=A0ABY7DUZ4_MYAAR|nr:hypothetical protein MAR_024508 [Mya arenaria]